MKHAWLALTFSTLSAITICSTAYAEDAQPVTIVGQPEDNSVTEVSKAPDICEELGWGKEPTDTTVAAIQNALTGKFSTQTPSAILQVINLKNITNLKAVCNLIQPGRATVYFTYTDASGKNAQSPNAVITSQENAATGNVVGGPVTTPPQPPVAPPTTTPPSY